MIVGAIRSSAPYLVQLEQGRAAHPSTQVLGAFARALRLNAVDRELLYRLAGSVAPTTRYRLALTGCRWSVASARRLQGPL